MNGSCMCWCLHADALLVFIKLLRIWLSIHDISLVSTWCRIYLYVISRKFEARKSEHARRVVKPFKVRPHIGGRGFFLAVRPDLVRLGSVSQWVG